MLRNKMEGKRSQCNEFHACSEQEKKHVHIIQDATFSAALNVSSAEC